MISQEQRQRPSFTRKDLARRVGLRAVFAFGESLIRQRRAILPHYPGNTTNEKTIIAFAIRERTIWNFLDFREMAGEALIAGGLELTEGLQTAAPQNLVVDCKAVVSQEPPPAMSSSEPPEPLGELFILRAGTPPIVAEPGKDILVSDLPSPRYLPEKESTT